MNKSLPAILFPFLILALLSCSDANDEEKLEKMVLPNILIAISDDQSYPHSSIYGNDMAQTPNFDRVAGSGVLFNNAIVASPGCSPSRAALLTGMYPWQLEHAGTHASYFGMEFKVLPDILEAHGYEVGFTGKGWGPGDWAHSGRTRNPAGNEYSEMKLESPYTGINSVDYAGNFQEFVNQKEADKPFLFWMGVKEPHRRFEAGSGKTEGKKIENAIVPPFLPDSPEIREDLLDYAVEIEWFDRHLGEALDHLAKIGELDNTIVIVTSDNGMAFPAAKANTYEYGIHVPLAVSWPNSIPAGQVVDALIGLPDLSPSLLGLTQLDTKSKEDMTGRDLSELLLKKDWSSIEEGYAYTGRERHSSSRYNSLSYPQRAVRSKTHLYIRNFKPERHPAGPPQKFEKDGSLGPMHGAYHDIDAAPSLDYLIANQNETAVEDFFQLAVGMRPAEELFDIVNDPGCLNNLAGQLSYRELQDDLSAKLQDFLKATNDPRVVGNGDVFEEYPRVSSLRRFPTPQWAKDDPVEVQEWLQNRRLQE